MPDEYTEDELNALPQTQTVFDAPELTFNDHHWQQQGYFISDVCSPSRPDCPPVGIAIPVGKLLIKTKGGYDIIDEVRK
jgi:hypothetical protein